MSSQRRLVNNSFNGIYLKKFILERTFDVMQRFTFIYDLIPLS